MEAGRTFSVGDVCGRYEVRTARDDEQTVELYGAVDVVNGDDVTLECVRWGEAPPELDVDALVARSAVWSDAAPRVIRVASGGTTADGTTWLAHEPVPADGIRARIEASGPLPPALALRIARGVAEGLGPALATGKLPPMLTPGAVRLRDDGSVALWVARLSTPEASHRPPEVIAGHAPDERAFVYGVGLLLYEMLAGEHPFARHVHGESDPTRAMEHAQCHRRPPSLSDAGLAPGVVALLRAALDKERGRRPPTLSALAHELGRLREHVVDQAGELPTGQREDPRRLARAAEISGTEKRPALPRRRAALWGATLGLGLALLLEIVRRWLA